MLFVGKGAAKDADVCIESPVTSNDFTRLYGDSHKPKPEHNPINISNYHGKESFDDRYIEDRSSDAFGSATSGDSAHHDGGRASSADDSMRSSFATAQTGRSPADDTTGRWLW